MKKLKFTLLGLACASSIAMADDFKLGYINVDRVFTEAKPAKEIKQVLKAQFDPQQKQLETLNTLIISEQKQMQQIANKAPSFDKLAKSDQTRLKNLEDKYRKDQGQFQQHYVAFQQGLQKSEGYALSSLMTKINAILKDISDKKGYDLVLTSNQLVFAKARYDLTDQVMEQLNTIDVSDVIKQLRSPETIPLPNPATGMGIAPAVTSTGTTSSNANGSNNSSNN